MTRAPIDAPEIRSLEVEEHARALGERLRSAELAEAEREQIEDLLLADDRLFEQVVIAEEEFIDSLASDRAARRTLAIPDGENRLAFARALCQAAGVRRPAAFEAGPGHEGAGRGRPRRLLPWAAAAAALALATSALWWAIPKTEKDDEAAIYILSPDSTRGAPPETVPLPAKAGMVEFWLEVSAEGNQELFAANLVAADAEILLHRERLRSEAHEWGAVVVFEVRTADLDTGHYRIHLRTGGADGTERLIERYELNISRGDTR